MEEATLRAKIQAMKNLLEAKRHAGSGATSAAPGYAYARPPYAPYQSRRPPTPVNRSWTRYSPAATRTHASANKVWRREDAAKSPVEATTTSATPPAAAKGKHKTWKRPVKVATKSKSRQLQVLRLEDGEYKKANGGFSLVRAGVKKNMGPTAAATSPVPMPVSRSNDAVHIGGIKYVVANGGKVLKRCSTEEHKASVTYRPGSLSLTTKSGAARAALVRAKATVQRARNKRHASKKAVKVRTVYCSFYNSFGFCKNKDACRFIHDSRRVAMCRKFLKNECNDPKCLLSHQHDENKVPDCKMFLRGACTRDNCRYRHVKVSATAALCEPFAQGYCPKGAACPLRHELRRIIRKPSPHAASASKNVTSNQPAKAADHRQKAPDVLQELREFVLPDKGDAPSVADFGIRLEQLPLKVQRDIWSALASGASPREEDAVDLAQTFLEVAARPRRRESDGVCLSLARMILSGEEEKREETMADAAFRRRMRRLTLNRVKFPSQEDDAVGLHTALSSGSVAGSRKFHKTSSLTKRSRVEALQDRYSKDEMDETKQDPRIKAGAQTLPTTKSQERPPLSKEIEDRAAALAKQLAHLSHADARVAVDDLATRVFGILAEVVNDVHTTYAANERSFQCLCRMLRMDAASDEVLLQITSALVDSNWSSRYAAIFLETSVLPKIRAAESVISRVLLQTALRFGSSYTSALVDSLLLPLLVGGFNPDTGRSFGPAQAEAITRILRSPDTVPTDQLDEFIQKSLSSVTASEENDLKQHLLTNESALLVFQNILNTKPALTSLTLERFIGACETALEQPEGEQLRGSLKFSTVVFTLISKYPQQCTGHVENLEAIASQLTSIMTKTILRALEKLKISK